MNCKHAKVIRITNNTILYGKTERSNRKRL